MTMSMSANQPVLRAPAADMIVDFPKRAMNTRQDASSPRSVRISPYSRMAVFESHPDTRPQDSWYTTEERAPLKRQAVREAQRMGRVLTVARMEGRRLPEEALFECVGIEHMLSLDKARRLMEHRRMHTDAILTSQHSCTPEQLSKISQSSSRQARVRANTLAEGYWNL